MITIACDQGHITAHKTVLCDYSQYLSDILSKYPQAEHPIVILTDLNISDIKVLVNYMYTGELVIANNSPMSLLNAAQILKISRLTADNSSQDQTPSLSSPTSPELSLNHHHNHRHHDDEMMLDDDLDDDDGDNEHVRDLAGHNGLKNNSNSINININNNNDNDSSNSNNNSCNNSNISISNNNSISINNSNSNNKIRCHLCNIGLSDVKCLYRHVLTRHLPEKWGYKCEFCDREFSRDDHLMRHYTTKHKNMEFDRERIRETRRLNREMAKNFHDEISTQDPQFQALQQLQH